MLPLRGTLLLANCPIKVELGSSILAVLDGLFKVEKAKRNRTSWLGKNPSGLPACNAKLDNPHFLPCEKGVGFIPGLAHAISGILPSAQTDGWVCVVLMLY